MARNRNLRLERAAEALVSIGLGRSKRWLAISAKEGYRFPMSSTVESLLRLPKKERMEIAESLWLSVADEQRMAIPANHKEILNQRLESYQTGQSVPIPHAEMMKRLRSK